MSRIALCLVVGACAFAACRERDALPGDLALPASSSFATADERGVKIVLSRSRLVAGGLPVASVPSSFERGFDPRDKKDGRAEELLLPALAAAVDAARGADRNEATVYVDGSTPYRPFTEVLYTIGTAGITTTHVAVLGSGGRATIDVRAPSTAEVAAARPSAGGWSPLGALAKPPPARITQLRVVADGVRVTWPSGTCFARKGDDAALAACAERARAELAGDMFFLTASAATPMNEVVSAIGVVSRAIPRVAFGLANEGET